LTKEAHAAVLAVGGVDVKPLDGVGRRRGDTGGDGEDEDGRGRDVDHLAISERPFFLFANQLRLFSFVTYRAKKKIAALCLIYKINFDFRWD
jgi:hypothetical protein